MARTTQAISFQPTFLPRSLNRINWFLATATSPTQAALGMICRMESAFTLDVLLASPGSG